MDLLPFGWTIPPLCCSFLEFLRHMNFEAALASPLRMADARSIAPTRYTMEKKHHTRSSDSRRPQGA